MFITKTKSGCKLCKKRVVNDIGLGDTESIDKEYRGESTTGSMIKGGAMKAAQMMSPGGQLLKMIPGMKTDEDPTGALLAPFTFGASMIPGMIPDSVMNPVKGITSKVGIDLNPAAMALAPLTFGASMLPGVSQIIGKISNMFSGLFKKATHMGDCMKWWSDSNIKSMVESIQPIPFSFEDYMMKNFPQFLRQYQIKQADGSWASVGVDRLLSIRSRKDTIADIYVGLIRSHSEIIQAECATQPNVIAQQGSSGINRSDVDRAWAEFKEYARQKEYSTIAERVDRLVAPYKVKETWGAIVKSRNANLIVPTEHGSQLRMPDNVIGVSRGALVMTLKTPQGQPTPIRK